MTDTLAAGLPDAGTTGARSRRTRACGRCGVEYDVVAGMSHRASPVHRAALAAVTLKTCARDGLSYAPGKYALHIRSDEHRAAMVRQPIRRRAMVRSSDALWLPRMPSITARLRDGESLEAVGKTYGVSRERIRQLIGIHGGVDSVFDLRAPEPPAPMLVCPACGQEYARGSWRDHQRSVPGHAKGTTAALAGRNAEIVRMYRAGMSQPTIGLRMHLTTNAVSRLLTAAGVVKRPTKGSKRDDRYRHWTPADIELAVRMHREGASLSAIGYAVDRGASSVRSKLVKVLPDYRPNLPAPWRRLPDGSWLPTNRPNSPAETC